MNPKYPLLGAEVTTLDKWQFAKYAPELWTEVVVPHSCNALDGCSSSYYRGKAYYKKTIRLNIEQLDHPYYLLFEAASQTAVVEVNGKQVAKHKGGYTPFVIFLKDCLKEGDNEILVMCDNREDMDLIPVSSDFNKNNGLCNPVHLLKMNEVYASPFPFGLYRMHVSTPSVSEVKAQTTVETLIKNYSLKTRKVHILLTLTDKEGNISYRKKEQARLQSGDSLSYKRSFVLSRPHLWNGIHDPYLYIVSIQLLGEKGEILDKMSTTVGYRYYRMDAERGFFLNGKSYPLRGVSMHQDWENTASALSRDQFDRDYVMVRELGANFLRLAHYPHNDYAFGKCDELGIIVQTEIPWVNVCGVNARKKYFDNIHSQMKEMIVNLYNHPSVVFWGMWNELDTWGNTDSYQGKIDCSGIVRETARLYEYAKSLDPYRFVGLTDCSTFKNEGYEKLKGDYYSENRYHGWYYNEFEDFTEDMNAVHKKMGIVNLSEYGAGNNPFCHSLNPLVTTKRAAGIRHDEEYANLFHESHLQQIIKMPFLNFTSLWIMFDFAVANRTEGYMETEDGINFKEDRARMYINDKGIVTRDRKTKKDVFYLYKSYWNKKEVTVHITSSRFTKRPSEEPVTIKVYSNAQSLTLYQNGKAVQTLSSSGEGTEVIWTFKPVKFQTRQDTFKVVSSEGVSDEAVFAIINKI